MAGVGFANGHKKVGGRTAGTPNRRIEIAELLNKRTEEGKPSPIERLFDIMDGLPVNVGDVTVYPTIEQQQKAAETLCKKYVPDLKAVEAKLDVEEKNVTVIIEKRIPRGE